MKKLIHIVFAWAILATGFAQVPVPAGSQDNPILLTGGTAHLGNGQVIQNSAVGFNDGKITFVGNAGDTSFDRTGYTVVDISGKHVYPGFILPNSQVGLQEVGAIRAMSDMAERG